MGKKGETMRLKWNSATILLFCISIFFLSLISKSRLSGIAPTQHEAAAVQLGEEMRRPFLGFKIYQDTIFVDNDIVEPVFGDEGDKYGDYNVLFEKHGICEKLLAEEIDEVWFWAGNGDGVTHAHLLEWTTTGPGWSRNFYNAPDCGEVITTMTFNFTRDQNLHAYGHRLEYHMSLNQPCDFSTKTWPWPRRGFPNVSNCGDQVSDSYGFTARPFEGNSFVGGCGDVHYPPNVGGSYNDGFGLGYDYGNETVVNSICLDWSQDGSGEASEINCENWGCSQKGYLIWWMQNFPGFENSNLDVNGLPHPNWWAYLFGGKYQGVEPSPVPTPTVVSPTTTPIPSPNTDQFAYLPNLQKPGGITQNGFEFPFNHAATMPRVDEINQPFRSSLYSEEAFFFNNAQPPMFEPVAYVIHLKAYEANGAPLSPVEDQVNEIVEQLRLATTWHGHEYVVRLSATFLGQDGASYAGVDCTTGTVADNVHIRLEGVQTNSPISQITVRDPAGGGVWANPCVQGSNWQLHMEEGENGQMDLYFKPFRNAPEGTLYIITIQFEDGTIQEGSVEGTAVFP